MQHRTAKLLLATLFAAAVTVVGGAGASTGTVTIRSARNVALGEILVSASGRTLYHLSSERPGSVTCTGACAITWPPLLLPAHAKPVAGPGVVASKLGTVRRPDGQLQVSYDGLALYLYAGDAKAGEANGQDLGGVWHALTPAGVPVANRLPTSKETGATTSASAEMGEGTDTNSMSSSTSTQSAPTGTATTSSSAGAGMWCAANPTQCVNGVPVTPAG